MYEKILNEYQIRKTKKEKTRFINFIKDEFEDVQIEESGKLIKSRNIVIGDPEKAKVILGAHYDTCALCPVPNFMTPTSNILFLFSQVFVTFMIIVIAIFVWLGIFFIIPGLDIINYIQMYNVILLIICFQIMFGFKNPRAANDNTSGVITLLSLMQELNEEEREKICVVLFDNEEKGLFGSKAFAKKHKEIAKNTPMLNFDCVGQGNNLIIMAKKHLSEDEILPIKLTFNSSNHFKIHHKKHTFKFMSDQLNFKKGIGVCTVGKFMICGRIHTIFDTVCKKENIEELVKMTKEFVETL